MARIGVGEVVGDLDSFEVHRLTHPVRAGHHAVVVHHVLRHAARLASTRRAPLATGELVPERAMQLVG